MKWAPVRSRREFESGCRRLCGFPGRDGSPGERSIRRRGRACLVDRHLSLRRRRGVLRRTLRRFQRSIFAPALSAARRVLGAWNENRLDREFQVIYWSCHKPPDLYIEVRTACDRCPGRSASSSDGYCRFRAAVPLYITRNAVGALNGGEAMRDHQARRVLRPFALAKSRTRNSVSVPTLEVTSKSRIRKRGLCANARGRN